jgi:phospholipase/carboxylesterase
MPLSYVHQFKAGSDPNAPPLLLLHGTGGTEEDLLPLGHALSPGSALLSPRGNVMERGAARFFARVAEGIFDSAEVTRRTHELADFIAAAANEYRFEPARLIAIGFSNGANIAATLLLLRPVVLAGAVLFRPMVVLDSTAPPHSLDGKHVLISSGTQDPLVPDDHPNRLAAHLRAGGAEVALHIHPAGHGLAQSDVTAAQLWFKNRPPSSPG